MWDIQMMLHSKIYTYLLGIKMKLTATELVKEIKPRTRYEPSNKEQSGLS